MADVATRIAPNIETMHKSRSASGSATFNCGDAVATALEGWPLENVRALAEYLELNPEKYDHLNPGHQRMVLGGRFRKLVRDQDKAHAQDDKAQEGWLWFQETAAQFAPPPEEEEAEEEETEEEVKAS